MDDTSASWILAGPLVATGVLLLALGWRGTARHVAATSGWARWWSTALLLPAVGVLLVVMGVLYGVGLPTAVLGLMYAAAGVAVVAGAVGAVRALGSGQRRRSAWTAALSVFLLVSFALIASGWDTATNVLYAVASGGLLVAGVVAVARRWRTADTYGRRGLLQSVALAVGLSCQAANQLLPAHLRTLGWVLTVIGMVSWACHDNGVSHGRTKIGFHDRHGGREGRSRERRRSQPA